MQKPKLRKIVDNVYCLEFKNAYDLSMTFLRCQEYYESPKFRETFFTISEFMEWYSKKYGEGSFSYPVDYVGFNLPGHVIRTVITKLRYEKYDQWTQYDETMYQTLVQIDKDYIKSHQTPKFYLIGVMNPTDDKHTLPHEVAHSLFTINPEYQRRMGALVNALPKSAWRTMVSALKKRGYASNVFDDEAQAYLATGLHELMGTKALKKASKEFRKVFKEYTKGII